MLCCCENRSKKRDEAVHEDESVNTENVRRKHNIGENDVVFATKEKINATVLAAVDDARARPDEDPADIATRALYALTSASVERVLAASAPESADAEYFLAAQSEKDERELHRGHLRALFCTLE